MLRSLVALIMLAASFGAAQADEHRFVIGVGGLGQIGYLPVTLADRLGYYRDAGLAVELDNFQGGTKSVEALVGGSVDAIAGAYDNAVILQAKGIYLTTVMTFIHNYGYVFGMAPDRAAKYHEPKDLKGMTIGVSAPGSSMENMMRILLQGAGLSIDDVATIGVGTGSSAIAALVSGRLDGVVSGDPEVSRMVRDHQLVPLIDTRTEAGMMSVYGGEAACAGSLVMAATIAAHADLVQAYVDALSRAHRWLKAASPDQVAAIVPESYLGGDAALYKTALAAARPSLTPDGRTTEARARVTYDSMVKAGRLPPDFKLDLARSFDDRFVDHALAQQDR